MRISDWSSDVCSSDLLSAHLGSAFSLEPVLWQSAWFRAHNRDDVISNLYFVGAGTHPGAGIPGVVGSAKATDRTSVAYGSSVSVRLDLGGRRIIIHTTIFHLFITPLPTHNLHASSKLPTQS